MLFRSRLVDLRDVVGRGLEGQQIGLLEVAVVVRVLLRTARCGPPGLLVPMPRLLAGGVAVIGGVLWAGVAGGGFSMVLVGLKVFPIVIIGGLDSIRGAMLGALFIGWLERMASWYISGGISHVVAYVVLLAVLLARPHGMFGRPDIERV